LNYRHLLWLVAIVALITPGKSLAASKMFVVKDGKANAQIVIADDAVPLIKLAAEDLQHYIAKITGATLPIVTVPTRDTPVQIYVGRSTYTDELGVITDDLRHGAFRMVNGPHWLILAGCDRKFDPEGLLGMAMADPRSAEGKRLREIWKEKTGSMWGLPFGQVWKQRNKAMDVAEQDERGSFNAVAAYLRTLGVRWYMPGDIGEVVPQTQSIALPVVDRTVKPDFDMRNPYILHHRFMQCDRDDLLWQLRMGFNHAVDITTVGHLGHGMDFVSNSAEFRAAYPDYFALVGGKRSNEKYGKPCLSSPGMFKENVGYVRAMFDTFDLPMVSVQPGDGYGSLCQCKLCEGKGTPQLGWYGALSNYIWTYINNLAVEIETTHPDHQVLCSAYSSYMLPPTNIDTLSPNLAVATGQLRSSMGDPKKRKMYTDARAKWLELMPEGRKQFVYIYDYYIEPWRKQLRGLPAYYPHLIAMDLRSLKGISRGEFIEVDLEGPVLLNMYVTARLWWDVDQGIDTLLDEYYAGFYGPAAQPMKAFVEYCEANWQSVAQDSEKIDRVHELFAAVQKAAPADSIYAQRVALIADYIRPLEKLQQQLAIKRENVPLLRFSRVKPDTVTIDGKLDDQIWAGHLGPGEIYLPHQSLGVLKDLKTGENTKHETRFQMAWIDNSLVIGIKCEDDPSTLNIGTKIDQDTNIWSGDCIEILIETQENSYYQIAINPAGAIYEMNRGGGEWNTLWRSGAEYATHIGKDSWSVEIRLTPADAMQQTIDVNETLGIKGRQPSGTFPWYFNICRQRMRDGGNELSAFSPTGTGNTFHVKSKFAKLHRKGL